MKNKLFLLIMAGLIVAGLFPFTRAEANDNTYKTSVTQAEEAVVLSVSGRPRVTLFFGLGHPRFLANRYYYRRTYCPYGGYSRYYRGRRYFYCYDYPRRYYRYPRYYRH